MSIEILVTNFAKANKIGAAKAETFAQEVIKTWQQENPVQPQVIRAGGRPVGEGTLQLRETVAKAVAAGHRTTDAILSQCPADTPKVYICNALKWLESQGRVRRIGKDNSKVGKGKKPVVWGLPDEMQDTE